MDSGLVAALEALRLGSRMQQKLVDLGIKSKTDISYINHEDLQKVGFNLVQQRKVMSLCHTACQAPRKNVEEDDTELEDLFMDSPAWLPSMMEASVTHHDECDPVSDEEDAQDESHGQMPYQRLHKDSVKATKTHFKLTRREISKMKRNSHFWTLQQQGRPMRLIFIRHGESEANINRQLTQFVPDHALHLTAEGRRQALDAGLRLRSIVKDERVKFIVSPYVRTRETLNGILHAWNESEWHPGSVHEDVRIREQEYGNYDSPEIKKLHSLKKDFGPFYYRFPEGESIADCYDRASLFVESLYRSWNDYSTKNLVIVGHGMMILVTLSRLMRVPPDEFPNLDRLTNCEFIVLERPVDDAKFHISYTWCEGKPKDLNKPFKTGVRPRGEVRS